MMKAGGVGDTIKIKYNKDMNKNIFIIFGFVLFGLLASHTAFAGTATLNWNANTESDLAGYKIYYGTSSRTGTDPKTCGNCGYSTSVNVGNVLTYTFSNLTDGATYYFSTSAYDASNNESSFSSEVSKAIPAVDTTAPAISSVAVSSTTSSGAIISWTTDEISDSQVEYGSTTSFGLQTTLNASLVASHSQTLSSLSSGISYYYRVKSRDAAGNLSTSSNYTFTTLAVSDTISPSVIANLSGSDIGQTSITIFWTVPTDDSGISSYDIRYNTLMITDSNFNTSTQVSGAPAPLNQGTIQQHILTGFTSNTTYYFAIKSKDPSNNTSGLSNIVQATTLSVASVQSQSSFSTSSAQTPSSVSTPSTAVTVPSTAVTVSTGSLIRHHDDPKIYFIENNQKRWISSIEVFNSNNFKWENVKEVDKTTLDNIAEGPNISSKIEFQSAIPISLKSGDLIRSSSGPEVYIITSEGKKEHIVSPDEFSKRGYKWDQIKIVAQDEISQILDFTPTQTVGAVEGIYPNGTLIKSENDPTVYIIINGKKRSIPDPASFNNWGYKWDQIKEVPPAKTSEFEDIRISSDIVRAQGDDRIYRIIGDKKLWIPSVKAFLDSGYKPNSEIEISQSELSDFEDAKYIKAKGGTYVYEIKGTKKYRITDISQIPAQDIKSLTLAEFAAYPTGK